MTVKKVEAERLGKWLKDPVTRVYLEAVAALNNEIANDIASGVCIGSQSGSTSELYHQYVGKLSGIQRCFKAAELMHDMGYVKGAEDVESV
jgi:hypothetical protein